MRRDLYQQRKAIAVESRTYPLHLVRINDDEWRERAARFVASGATQPVEVWRSRGFLVQIFVAALPATERLSVIRTTPERDGWRQEISWDDLQRLKAECGRGDRCAVEVYPADADVVAVANMRHLWILAEPPAFTWRSGA